MEDDISSLALSSVTNTKKEIVVNAFILLRCIPFIVAQMCLPVVPGSGHFPFKQGLKGTIVEMLLFETLPTAVELHSRGCETAFNMFLPNVSYTLDVLSMDLFSF